MVHIATVASRFDMSARLLTLNLQVFDGAVILLALSMKMADYTLYAL